MVSLLVAVASGLAVVVVTLPFVPDVAPSGFGWAVFLVVPLLLVLHPAVLDRLINRGSADPAPRPAGEADVAARDGAGRRLGAGLLGLRRASGLGARDPLGAPPTARTMALAVGGYALAWVVGFVVVVAPAGAGAREVALCRRSWRRCSTAARCWSWCWCRGCCSRRST